MTTTVPDSFYPSKVEETELIGDVEPRCTNEVNGRLCNKKLAEFVTRPWRIMCVRCKHMNISEVPDVAEAEGR